VIFSFLSDALSVLLECSRSATKKTKGRSGERHAYIICEVMRER